MPSRKQGQTPAKPRETEKNKELKKKKKTKKRTKKKQRDRETERERERERERTGSGCERTGRSNRNPQHRATQHTLVVPDLWG